MFLHKLTLIDNYLIFSHTINSLSPSQDDCDWFAKRFACVQQNGNISRIICNALQRRPTRDNINRVIRNYCSSIVLSCIVPILGENKANLTCCDMLALSLNGCLDNGTVSWTTYHWFSLTFLLKQQKTLVSNSKSVVNVTQFCGSWARHDKTQDLCGLQTTTLMNTMGSDFWTRYCLPVISERCSNIVSVALS